MERMTDRGGSASIRRQLRQSLRTHIRQIDGVEPARKFLASGRGKRASDPAADRRKRAKAMELVSKERELLQSADVLREVIQDFNRLV